MIKKHARGPNHFSTQPLSKGRVVVIGSSNTDLVVEVDRIPRPGETVLGGRLLIFAGGKGANQAVAAVRAGAPTCFLGAFGDDANGRDRRSELVLEGIDCASSITVRGEASGVAMIALQSRGQKQDNAIVVAPGSNHRLKEAAVRRGLRGLTAKDVLLCSLEVPLATVLAAAQAARKQGAKVILNPAPFPTHGLPMDLLAQTDYLTPNEHEMADLMGGRAIDPRALARFQTQAQKLGGCMPTLIITRGAAGVDLYHQGYYQPRVAAPPKVKVVDTVGAGDCFSGSLAAALALGETDLYQAIRFAISASALCVTQKGAQSAMPRRRAILAFLPKVNPRAQE